jgi:hypothetical protein
MMRAGRRGVTVGPTTSMLPVLIRPLSPRVDARRSSAAALRLAEATLLVGLDRLRAAGPAARPATWVGVAVADRIAARRRAQRRALRMRQARRALLAAAALGAAAAVASRTRAVCSRWPE